MHPWLVKFNQCIPSIDEATRILHVKFDKDKAFDLMRSSDWPGLEEMLLDLGSELKKRNSKHAKSLDTLVWALYQVFPFKSL